MTDLQIVVHGAPAPQGSKRHVGRGVMVEQAGPRLKSWREAVRSEAQRAIEAGATPILTGPIFLRAVVFHTRPKSHYRTGRNAHQLRADAPYWVATTPDLDKVMRSTCDALTDAGVWRDDRQIAAFDVEQIYADSPHQPGALITITPLL